MMKQHRLPASIAFFILMGLTLWAAFSVPLPHPLLLHLRSRHLGRKRTPDDHVLHFADDCPGLVRAVATNATSLLRAFL